MTLSVVIATFNRKNILRKLLNRFEKQTNRDFEVVVAVDGSTDGTQEWLGRYSRHAPFSLRWIDTGLNDRYGLAVARNRGIEVARGEAVVILDDDSFPSRQFVEEHKKSVRPRTLTGGWRHMTDPYYEGDQRMHEYLEVYGDCTPRTFTLFTRDKHKYVVENNTCMYKRDWIEAGLFDESVSEYGVIAYDFLDRLEKKGFVYQFNPRALIYHKDEYKRSYGGRRKDPHTIPVWLKRFVYPIKKWIKSSMPSFYEWIKRVVGRSI